MKNLIALVVFRLDTQRYVVALSAVERIVRAVEVTRLPNAPAIVLGVIDVEGRILPVLDLRRRLRLRERKISPDDQFLIAQTTTRSMVLVVDEALGVIEHAATEMVGVDRIVPGLGHIQGVIQLDDGLVLIHDLETFLSSDEARALDEAMEPEAVHGN